MCITLLCISPFSWINFSTSSSSSQHLKAARSLFQLAVAFWGSFSRWITASASFVARSYGFTPSVPITSWRVDSVIKPFSCKWLANFVITAGSLESASHNCNRTELRKGVDIVLHQPLGESLYTRNCYNKPRPWFSHVQNGPLRHQVYAISAVLLVCNLLRTKVSTYKDN